MFLGEYTHSLDAKGRLIIPARLRESLEPELVLTRGYEQCLALYPISEWRRLAARASELPRTSRVARAYRRLLFSNAFELNLDSSGRILIPACLREYGEIKDEAKIVGLNRYIEIWDPSRWDEVFAGDTADMDAIFDQAANMGV